MTGRAPVGVIGCGSWGTTIAQLAARAGNEVRLWGRRQKVCDEINSTRRSLSYTGDVELDERITATAHLEELGACRPLFVVVPSQAFREVVRELGDHVDGAHLLIHATKGFELGTFRRMSEIILEETCCRKVGVLAGPNLSGEILAGQPAVTVVSSRFPEVIDAARGALAGTSFRIYSNDDPVGVEIAGALKNVIALATGFIEGLGLGYNTRAALLTRGMSEIARLGMHLGAVERTFSGLSGIGDLIATSSTPKSRNFRVGMELGRGRTLDDILESLGHVAEGVHTTRAVHAFAQRRRIDLPLTAAVYALISGEVSPEEVIPRLMSREVGGE